MEQPDAIPLGPGATDAFLTVNDIKNIIADAQIGGTDPLSIATRIFSRIGHQTTVTGAVLREALSASVPLAGPLTAALGSIQQITKAGNGITLTNSQDIQLEVNGTQIRLKKDVSLEVAENLDCSELNNIAGVSVHKFLWIDIHSVQLRENKGQKIVRMATSAGTKEFTV